MLNKSKITSAIVVTILFVSAISGTAIYYNGILNDKNSKIASLNIQILNQNKEIANLASQIENLTDQVTNLKNLTSANLVTALGIKEILDSAPANHLFIEGTVTNTGQGIAYNAGLQVEAYDAANRIIIDVNVPATYATFVFGSFPFTIDSGISNSTSLSLENIYSGQSVNVFLALYHAGTISKWNVTAVWTNSP